MAKDIYHDTVRIALEKDGWTITDDPLTLKVGGRSAFVDLGAEKLWFYRPYYADFSFAPLISLANQGFQP